MFAASLLLLIAQTPADPIDPKLKVDLAAVHDPRQLEIGQVAVFAEARANRASFFIRKGASATAGRLSYSVASIKDESQMIVQVRFEVTKSGKWYSIGDGFFGEETFYLSAKGLDTSKLVDGKEVKLPGKFKVSGTLKTSQGRTLFVVEPVKD